jgi:uncharacterized membrane protein YphA (DoxX/SURF4 family)
VAVSGVAHSAWAVALCAVACGGMRAHGVPACVVHAPRRAAQVRRVAERLASPTAAQAPVQQHFGRPDARDNHWLLLECVLALPLALGVCTTQVSLLLCGAVLGEAAMHWGWWGAGMPSWHYRQGVREHFFTNAAVAGGLLLLQSFGGGALTVDALLAKQD